MRKKYYFIVFIFVILGCYTWEEQKPKSLNDNRFNGKFVYLYEYVAPDGINETTEKLEFTFNKTNQAQWYHSYRNYDKGFNGIPGKGWTIWSNYCPVKFEISNGLYRITKWGIDEKYENEFTEWQPYIFSDDGNTLILQNYIFELANKKNYTLIKE